LNTVKKNTFEKLKNLSSFWGSGHLENDKEDVIESATDNVLKTSKKESFISNIGKHPTDYSIPEGLSPRLIAYTIAIARSKFLKNEDEFVDWLKRKNMTEDHFQFIIDKLRETVGELDLPVELVKRNPFIDPYFLHDLYSAVKREDLGEWLLKKPRREKERERAMDLEIERQKPFQEKSFYFQFEELIERLDKIFDIQGELNDSPGIFHSIRSIVRDANAWMMGQNLRYFVDRDLEDERKKKELDLSDLSNKINGIIRNTTIKLSRQVSFKLAKYVKIWGDVVQLLSVNDPDNDKVQFASSLSTMIELGSVDPRSLEFMSMGLPRAISLYLAREAPQSKSGELEAWLRIAHLPEIPELYKRYLKRNAYI
jgi:hypothetical protein